MPWKDKNREKEYKMNWYKSNKERLNKKSRQNYLDNKEVIDDYQKQYRTDNKTQLDIYKKEYAELNREKIKEYKKQYYIKNKERINKRINDRIKSDPIIKLKHSIRCVILKAFYRGGYKKDSRTFEILGCSFDEFKYYLESKFIDGMSWDNQGEWHFDHIIPVSYAKTKNDIYKLNHYTNFQPLWGFDNLSKGNRFIG